MVYFLPLHNGSPLPFSSACSSFPDFQIHEIGGKLMYNNVKNYSLLVRGKSISMTDEVYKAYYQCREREKEKEKVPGKLAERNNISIEGCNEKGISVEYIISVVEDFMEDRIMTEMMLVKLRQCVKMLDESERMLVEKLYLQGKVERSCRRNRSPLMMLHDRKIGIKENFLS